MVTGRSFAIDKNVQKGGTLGKRILQICVGGVREIFSCKRILQKLCEMGAHRFVYGECVPQKLTVCVCVCVVCMYVCMCLGFLTLSLNEFT